MIVRHHAADPGSGSLQSLVQQPSITAEEEVQMTAQYEAMRDLDELNVMEELVAEHQQKAFLVCYARWWMYMGGWNLCI